MEAMLRTYSLYDATNGLFTGKRLHADDPQKLAAHLPDGIAAIEGAHDHRSQRVQLDTGRVVDYQPPPPAETPASDARSRGWRRTSAAGDSRQRRSAVLAMIRALEVRQGRTIREATLGDALALPRLREIDAAILELRKQLC
jgi:hypothetical protein